MADRLVILLAAAGAGAMVLGFFGVMRRRWTPGPERLQVEEFGLELMEGCCAFVVFSSPTCRPCKTAMRVVDDAVAASETPTEVVAIDATERPDVAARYEVRAVPTVFLITASGHVVRRWREVPDADDARTALTSL